MTAAAWFLAGVAGAALVIWLALAISEAQEGDEP